MRAQLFVYDPESPGRDGVLAYLCGCIEKRAATTGGPVHISIGDPKKTRAQEQKYHAMLADIARDARLFHQQVSAEVWKRVCIDAFKTDTVDDPDLRDLWARFGAVEFAPALNRPGFVMVGEQSREFGVKLASAFIEWLYAFGADNAVTWKELAKLERGNVK